MRKEIGHFLTYLIDHVLNEKGCEPLKVAKISGYELEESIVMMKSYPTIREK